MLGRKIPISSHRLSNQEVGEGEVSARLNPPVKYIRQEILFRDNRDTALHSLHFEHGDSPSGTHPGLIQNGFIGMKQRRL